MLAIQQPLYAETVVEELGLKHQKPGNSESSTCGQKRKALLQTMPGRTSFKLHLSFLLFSDQLSWGKNKGRGRWKGGRQREKPKGKGNNKYYFSAESERTVQMYSSSTGGSNTGTISIGCSGALGFVPSPWQSPKEDLQHVSNCKPPAEVLLAAEPGKCHGACWKWRGCLGALAEPAVYSSPGEGRNPAKSPPASTEKPAHSQPCTLSFGYPCINMWLSFTSDFNEPIVTRRAESIFKPIQIRFHKAEGRDFDSVHVSGERCRLGFKTKYPMVRATVLFRLLKHNLFQKVTENL